MNPTLQIDPRDNVAVALKDLDAGTSLPDEMQTREKIPAKHKFALQEFQPGDKVQMYGVTVATVLEPIAKGGLLTTRNVRHDADQFSADQEAGSTWKAPDVSKWQGRTFQGYHRRNGDVGTANHWIVVPLVFCENRNLRIMREALAETLGYDHKSRYAKLVSRLAQLRAKGASPEDLLCESLPEAGPNPDRLFPNVDGVKFLTHGLGCGGSPDDSRALCALLAGYITHPNVAGATVLSLGCQIAQVSALEEEIVKRDPHFNKPLQIFEQQKSQSEEVMMTEALKTLFASLCEINELQREAAPLSKLTFGMECGGSDGFSGISANPTLGQISDMVVALGGRSILSEFPELCGVEQELINRCVTTQAAERFSTIMRSYSARAEEVGAALHMNPSPGNIADGLITDAIKSAGAAKKGGSSPIVDVLDYTEPVTKDGLNLLCTPGNDVESTTAMTGSGANIMLFTTGLGTPTGNPITPTLKVATNSDLANRMSDIIDFDTGAVIRGERSIPELADDLLELAVQTASGEYVPKAVRLGQDDFLPWKRGVSL